MAEPFLGEIRMFSSNFPPKGWEACNGQLLPINQNQALFSLLGTNYGGDGRVNFALPDLRSRVPIHFDGDHPIGMRTAGLKSGSADDGRPGQLVITFCIATSGIFPSQS